MRGRKPFAITTIPKRHSISRTASPSMRSMSQASHDRHDRYDNRIGNSRKSNRKRSESPVVGNREGIALQTQP